MPLVTHHHQPTTGQNDNASQEDLLPKHPRVIYSIFFTTLGFLFFLTLRSVIGKRRKKRIAAARSGTLPISNSAVSVALNHQQRFWLSDLEKSRGVSSNNYTAMSANHPPEKSQPKTELCPYPAVHYAAATRDEDRSRGLPSDHGGIREDAVSLPWDIAERDGQGKP